MKLETCSFALDGRYLLGFSWTVMMMMQFELNIQQSHQTVTTCKGYLCEYVSDCTILLIYCIHYIVHWADLMLGHFYELISIRLVYINLEHAYGINVLCKPIRFCVEDSRSLMIGQYWKCSARTNTQILSISITLNQVVQSNHFIFKDVIYNAHSKRRSAYQCTICLWSRSLDNIWNYMLYTLRDIIPRMRVHRTPTPTSIHTDFCVVIGVQKDDSHVRAHLLWVVTRFLHVN